MGKRTEAAALSLGALSRRYSTRWASLAGLLFQAVAWIAYRDVERVRDVTQAFRDHWRIWRDPGPFILFEGATISGCDMGQKDLPKFRGWDLALVPPASFAELFREENKKSVQAAKELQARLISGAIVASGFKDWSGSRVVIPALEWHEMCFDPHSADLASFTVAGRRTLTRAC